MNIKKIYRNIFYSFFIAILILFVGLIISFVITKVIPVDPVEKLLPLNYTTEQYNRLYHQLGYDQPLIVQFFRYIKDLFTKNWGRSYSIEIGKDVLTLMKERFPRMIELLILPIIVGLGVGILFGKIAIKYKDKWADKVIRMHAILGISVPVFWLGLLFQYIFAYQLDWLPAIGFKSIKDSYEPITGFIILDALIDGNIDLAIDAIRHYILPISVLTIAISSLITLKTRSALEGKKTEKSIISNSLIIGESFGLIIMFYILIEINFGMKGIGEMLMDAIQEKDIFVLSGILFALITTLVIVIFIANIIFSLYKYVTVESRTEHLVSYNKFDEEEVSNVG
ncbi:MAG: ABC transporter permease [Promethearchaeota archaeon]